MAATPSGKGYWLVASDGGIFTFGNAPFLGSKPTSASQPGIAGIALTPTGNGYWLATTAGTLQNHGDAEARPGTPALAVQIVGVAAVV
jgi:hypothetical protein